MTYLECPFLAILFFQTLPALPGFSYSTRQQTKPVAAIPAANRKLAS